MGLMGFAMMMVGATASVRFAELGSVVWTDLLPEPGRDTSQVRSATAEEGNANTKQKGKQFHR